MRGLLPSTLSHGQVYSTIVDRISSGLPFFPYYQHFSIQTPFKQIAFFSYLLQFILKRELPCLRAVLHLDTGVISLNCFLCCSTCSILFKFSNRKHRTETTQHLWGLHLCDHWGLSSCKLGVQMTQDIPFTYTERCDTVQTRSACCPGTQTEGRPLLCCCCKARPFEGVQSCPHDGGGSSFSPRHSGTEAQLGQKYTIRA